MKKVSTFLCMVLCSIALHANVVTGTCGDNLTWSYDTETKALTIEGSGAMTDYDNWSSNQPWAQVSSDILSVSLPEGLTTIGRAAFCGCPSLTSITLPNSVTSIGNYVFHDCSALTSITLPNSVTSIGEEAFSGCSSLTSITIPNSVTSIGDCAFTDCSSLTSVTLPNSVTRIGSVTFRSCYSLTSITIPNSVTSIGYQAFAWCTSLTSITIPNSVTSIGGDAFSSCAQVTVECTTPPTIESGTFKSDATISVPCFTMGVYLVTPVWQFLPIVDDGTYRVNLSATKGSKATITATDCDANTATIEATTDSCMHFVQWSDGNTDNPRTLNLTQDTTLVAQFESTTYQVNIFAGENGFLRVNNYWDYLETDTFSVEMTDCGNELTTNEICAEPDEGYYFAGWSDGSTERCRNFTITQDTTITALFKEIKYYSVTLRGNSIIGYFQYINEKGDIDKMWFNDESERINITVCEGLSVYFYENNMECGTWIGWSDGVTDNERTITITSDTVITSLFDATTYQVNISAAEHGSLTQYGEPIGNIETTMTDCDSDGEWIDICAVPDEGYYFTGWSDGNTEQYRTFTITQDTTITALFEEIKYYSVTLRGNSIRGYYQYINNDWGGISDSWFGYDSEINITVGEGLSVYFYEDNMSCGTWLGWSDGVTDNERTITITSDTVITSLFNVPTYQVNISAAEHGSLTQYGEPIGNIETTMTDCDSDGEWIDNICAVPDEGYYFTGWSDGYADACRSIKVVSDTTLVAHFAKKQQVQVLVGVESACKNMGTVNGSGIFYQSDVVTITATPNEGYHFVEWSDGNSIANREIYLTSDTTLFATFAAGDMGGKCGDNLYWIWDNGALTITGSGDMDLENHPAWWQYEEMQITSVSMPEGMTSIYAWAFYEQPITTILIPASVEEVGDRAFADNNRLTHFEYLGNNIHWETEDWYWDNMPLYGCRNLQYFRGNLELGEDYCTMSDTVIISNGQALDDWYDAVYVDNTNAYDSIIRGEYDYVNAVRTLYLPAGLVEIGDYALQNARFLGGITIPAGVTRIGISAFEDCRSMDSVVFAGNNVEEIGAWAFYNCHSLRSLTLPEGVEEVGLAAFYGCTYLKELTIPSTMKKIADNGFAGCEKLGTMYVNALVPPTIEAKTFEDVNRATPVFVPKGTLERYQADEYWSEFFNMAEYEAPTGNLNTAAEDNGLRKVVRDGQVLIIRGDKTYTILGENIQ
ncbi:MAG: leucine-rich repeat protein [Bacteroidales bacterium]|nr:leucine-rich repeat protein [Bacteroidales bacterium]